MIAWEMRETVYRALGLLYYNTVLIPGSNITACTGLLRAQVAKHESTEQSVP